MMDYLTLWLIIGTIFVFPFLTKEIVLELSWQAKQQKIKAGGTWSVISVLTFSVVFIILLWPLVLALTFYELTFFDDEES